MLYIQYNVAYDFENSRDRRNCIKEICIILKKCIPMDTSGIYTILQR